jgi:hypothetical protein
MGRQGEDPWTWMNVADRAMDESSWDIDVDGKGKRKRKPFRPRLTQAIIMY